MRWSFSTSARAIRDVGTDVTRNQKIPNATGRSSATFCAPPDGHGQHDQEPKTEEHPGVEERKTTVSSVSGGEAGGNQKFPEVSEQDPRLG